VNTDDRIGGILIDANSLFIRDEAAVSVDNQASGAAGVILVLADEDIILRDQGQISAIATSGEGGSIFLSSGDFLVLVNNSGISTQAGSPDRPGGINGGNITIDTRYLIAAPFSSNDLDAEAFEGPGGRIEIDANRLYDIEERSLSSLSNDISVTSGYGPPGEVTSNVLNTDPTQGLANLPANPIDPTTLIAETCAPIGSIEDREKNTFTVTERGGLPPDPNAAFPGEAAINDLETPAEGENTPDDPSSTNITTPTPVAAASPQEPEIVEAQGWMRGENGNIIFTAQAPVVTPNHSVRTPASTCHVSTSPQ
jgi:large exoprotein involved in heme utilization and adhesion